MLVVFESDDAVTQSGFRISVDFVDRYHYTPFTAEYATPEYSSPDNITSTPNATCGGNISSGSPGIITSPNFPGRYPNNVYCEWNIEAPADEIREIKKKEKRAARRVTPKHTKIDPKNGQKDEKQPSESQTQPATDQVQGQDGSGTQRIEAEKAKEEEERIKKEKEAEEERKRLAEEEQKQKEEQIRKEKEQEAVKQWKEEQEKREQEQLKEKEEEEKKKQAALELLERDKKERERKEALQKSKADRDAKINALLKPETSDKQSAKKRAPSAKPKSAKGRAGSSATRRSQKSPSSAKHKRAPQGKASEAEPVSQMTKMEPEKVEAPAESETEKKKETLSVDVPQVEVDGSTKEEVVAVDRGTQSEQQDEGMPPAFKHHDVHSWLASAADDVPVNAESVTDNRSLPGDGRSDGPESRSRSPAAMSDAGSEMTVPHVDIPLPPDRDDDWWWRKSRRRRMKSATPSGEMSAEVLRPRPHTAHVISELTTQELEKAFEDTLRHYQGCSGTPEKLHQNEGTHFDDNWHDRAIERHMLLKMQRHLRAQSANDKARRLFREKQERRRGVGDKKSTTPSPGERPTISVTRASSCMTRASTSLGRSGAASVHGPRGGGGDSLSPGRAYSVHSMPAGAGRRTRMSSAAPSAKRPVTAAGRIQHTPAPSEGGRTMDKAELGAETPFRCRLNPATQSPGRSRSGPVHKEEFDMRLLDPRNPVSGQFRPRTGASVPSKCSRYVLVESTRIAGDVKVMPTVLEQRLIEKRFPQHQEEWIGHAKPPPRFRPPLLLYHPPAFNQYATT